MSGPRHPVITPWDRPFWAAAAEGRLVAQHCLDCGRLQHYPRPACVDCLSQRREWVPLSGQGTVWSFTVIRQVADPAFAAEVPFLLADVELDEGVRMTGRLDSDLAQIGQRVQAVFHRSPAMSVSQLHFSRSVTPP